MFRKKWMKVLILLIIVGGVGALFLTGVITPRDAQRYGRRAYHAGTGAIDTAKDAVTPADRKAAGDYAAADRCRRNLQSIEAAKRRAAGRVGITIGDVPEAEVKKEMGGSLPSCPSGGRYTIGTMYNTPKCSIGPAGPSDPKDDHVVNQI